MTNNVNYTIFHGPSYYGFKLKSLEYSYIGDFNGNHETLETKKPRLAGLYICAYHDKSLSSKRLATTYFHLANARLSSACYSFTSEFGMGSGGSYKLSSPKQLCSG